jgi:spore coat polysaccharide biosynthesis protein SpsF (cytidylyltransferase family)
MSQVPALAIVDLGGPRAERIDQILAPVGPWSVLEHTIRRIRLSGLPIVVTLVEGGPDTSVEGEIRHLGIDIERRPEADALGRCLGVAASRGASEIVWVDPGCVFLDTGAALRTLEFRRRVSADLVTECGLPTGTAVEAVSVEALGRASAAASDPYDREHVTSLVRRDRRFRALRAVAPGVLRRPGLRLTVETADQLDFVREVYAATDRTTGVPDLAAVVAAADALIVRSFAAMRPGRAGRVASASNA